MLTLALSNALSGLQVNQQALAVISQNISNANNADYSRQLIKQESIALGSEVGNGVRIKEVTRAVDDFISRAVVTRGAEVARTGIIKDYYDQVEQYFGQPGSNNSIDSYIDNYFNALNSLQVNPKDASVKLSAVNAARNVAQEISSLATNIEDMRFQADKAVEDSVNTINFLIGQLQGLNSAILNATQNNASVTSLLDSVQANLNKLSAEIDINYRFLENGTISVTASSGYTLLSGSSKYELDYTSSLSAEDFMNNIDLNSIELYSIDLQGNRAAQSTAVLATGGFEDTITSSITGGRIKGLMEIRDKLLPDMVTQLDNLAADLRDGINAAHNKGSAFPPVATLSGETLVDPTIAQEWSGTIMIAALNEDGTPIDSPYLTDSGVTGVPPLVLDLASLSDGGDAGEITTQTIIDEINRYYGAPQPRTKMGPLTNITLASKSEALDGNSGTFDFNLDLSNFGTSDATVVITGASVNNGAAFTVPGAFPTAGFLVEKGGSERGIDFTLDMSAGTNTNYAVNISVQITDADGNVTTDTITYNISEATEDLMNRRYTGAAVSGAGDASIESASVINPILRAKLVDASGAEIAKDPDTGDYLAEGYLVLEGLNDNRVAISEMTSKHLGISGADNATNRGFSHYFGLNNFFSGGTTDSNEDAALNMAVRADILEVPSRIATGILSRSNTDATIANYTYEIGESSSSVIGEMARINLNNHKFAGAGSMPAISVTFSGYAAQILGNVASVTVDAQTNAQQAELIHSGFAERDRNMRGVNIDEEMANTIIFQNAYAANARVISVVNEMYDALLATFN